MPDITKLLKHARDHQRRLENRTKNKKLIENAEKWKRGERYASKPVSPPQAHYESPPYAPAVAASDYDYYDYFVDTGPAYVPDSPPYVAPPVVAAPVRRRGVLRRSSSPLRRHGRRIQHAHTRDEREYEIENDVDDAGNVLFVRYFRPDSTFRTGTNPGLMKTRTGALIGQDPMVSTRYYSTEARLQSEHGPCIDDGARQELVRVLDMIRGIEATIIRHGKRSNPLDGDETEMYEDLYAELEDLIRQKRMLFERCGYNPDLAFGRLHKAAKKTKSTHKKKKYMLLIHLLSL